MQIREKYTWLKHLDFMIVDLISLFISFVLSYWLKFGRIDFVVSDAWMRLLLIILLLNIVITLFTSPYSGIFRRSYYMEIERALELAVLNLVATSVLIYLFKMGESFSREVFFVMYGIYFVLSLLMKYIWKKLLVSKRITIKSPKTVSLFIVTDGKNVRKVLDNTSAGDFQLYDIKGICLADETDEPQIDQIPVIHDGFVDYVLGNEITDVLIAVPPTSVDKAAYRRLADNGINIHISVEAAVGFQTEEQIISNVGVYKTLSISEFSFTPGQNIYLGIKRIVDILCGLAGLVLLMPVTLFVKAAYLITGDKAKIIYRQARVGQYGKTIRIWKFRSMVPNADEILEQLLKQENYRKEWEENQKFEQDPRITKVGRFIRKTSIDELPQLINVLAGDMSLVGPRPLVKGELEAHGGLKLYQRVKPGITGWWGCNGRSNIGYRERLELEYYYVKNCSFYLDILCLARTITAVLKKDGAQ